MTLWIQPRSALCRILTSSAQNLVDAVVDGHLTVHEVRLQGQELRRELGRRRHLLWIKNRGVSCQIGLT